MNFTGVSSFGGMQRPSAIGVPMVIDENRGMTRSWDIYSKLLEQRIVMLDTEVNEARASVLVAELLYLASLNDEPITMYINSPGGVITAGMSIYDTMQMIKAPVCTIVTGMAASMGAFILSGGEKGMRYVYPNAEVMIHQPSGGAQGQATEIQITAEWILRTKKHMAEILAANCGQPVDKVMRDTERDHWMTAQQAIDYGIVDGFCPVN